MFSSHPASAAAFLALTLSLILCACGGPETPKEILDQADTAWRSEKDYNKALTLYSKILDWKGPEGPTPEQRFEAALSSVRCRTLNKDFDSAVQSITAMGDAFGDKLTLQNYRQVVGDLLNQKATSQAIDVLAIAGERFPAQKDLLTELVAEISKNATSDDLARLKTLGYL